MKTLNSLLLTVSIGLAFGALPEVAIAQVGEGFNAFRFVRNRAIFDPGRQSMQRETSSAPSQTISRSNFIALTGTMVAGGKKLAFFNGSRSEYSKVIPEGESIADFKLTSIGPGQVELSLAGKLVTVAVGQHVPLAGSSIPATSDVPVTAEVPAGSTPNASPSGSSPISAPNPSATAPGSAPATAPAPAPTSDKSELLRRMMERRQKETSP
jgi:hypothetical protein